MKTFDTWMGEEILCRSPGERTPQGTYAYRLSLKTGPVDVEVGEREMLQFTHSSTPICGREAPRNSLPEDAAERNKYPMADGLLDYFPNALAEVSRVSFIGNQQHNPGEPMHWARGKSTDHRNKIIRHLIDAGKKDEKGVRHSAYVAWRALANLQEELEREEGAPLSRGSRPPEEK